MFVAFNNYADFSGRASRSEYWQFQLLNFIVMFVASFLAAFGSGLGPSSATFMFGVVLGVFWILISAVPNIAVTVRRFHDHNVSGWWYPGRLLLGLIPYVGILAILFLLITMARAGSWGPNRFGPDPVNPWRGPALV